MTSNLTLTPPPAGAARARVARRARLAGRVDSHVVPALSATLAEAMRVADDVVLDLSDVRFLDVPAMRALEAGRGELAARGGQLLVGAASAAAAVILELTADAGILDAPVAAMAVAA